MTESKHQCPLCKKPCLFAPSNPWRPFCSERCKLIDLGEWASGERRLPGPPLTPDDLDDCEDFLNDSGQDRK